ncbi:MAG: HAD family hydrolase [Chloroflexota bacterium]
MPELKAVLFDLDDTLISWADFDGDYYSLEKPRFESLSAYLTEKGYSVPPVDQMLLQFRDFAQAGWEKGRETLIAPHMPRILAQVLAEFDIDADAVGMDDLIDAYGWTKVQGTTVFEEVPDTLQTLLANDIKIGIVTNAFQPMAMRDHELEAHGLLQYFESCRFSAADVGHLKPHPAIFEAALACIGTAPEETVFVGDSLTADIAGANRVHMKTIWRDTGYHSSRLSLGMIEPNATIKRLDEMLPHFDGWFSGWRDDQ